MHDSWLKYNGQFAAGIGRKSKGRLQNSDTEQKSNRPKALSGDTKPPSLHED